MKDTNDKSTTDLFDKPRRGRPATGRAKSDAERMRTYRKRLKDRGDDVGYKDGLIDQLKHELKSANKEYAALELQCIEFLTRYQSKLQHVIRASEDIKNGVRGDDEWYDHAYKFMRNELTVIACYDFSNRKTKLTDYQRVTIFAKASLDIPVQASKC
ncbi:MAG: hypothetical protein ACXW01_04305 [Methylobacter sp.]